MGKFIDLSGQKFGNITVIEKDNELSHIKKRVYWKCKCQCGREKSIRGDSLSKIKSCGECEKDLLNLRFGRLKVIERVNNDKFGHRFWLCQCDCGNTKIVMGDNLKRGLTQSCGCLHSENTHSTVFIDLTEQKFGRLTAKTYYIENGKTFWKCLCDCGNYTTVARSNLINGHTQSCGCINTSIGEAHIEQLLCDNFITFEKEKVFKDLPNRRFDFYLPNLDRVIEFDGRQHFKSCSWYKTEDEFNRAIERDKEKNNYCFANGIAIVRIPYTERDRLTLEMILGNKYLLKFSDMEEAQEIAENDN